MKIAIRIFALSVVFVGGAAAFVAPKSAPAVPSHQSASASLPIPGCGPKLPTCSGNPNSGN